MNISESHQRVPLDTGQPIWDRCYLVAPLLLIGTREPNGEIDLAPKHMASPMGWNNYFGFVCAPTHSTYSNIERTGEFTVSFPKPSQLLFTSLAASPRCDTGDKPILDAFTTFSASKVDGEFITDAYLYLECKHFKTIDGFGENSLITGEVIAAFVDEKSLRKSELDDQELIHDAPLLAYLPPNRFATIDQSSAFPFPADMKK